MSKSASDEAFDGSEELQDWCTQVRNALDNKTPLTYISAHTSLKLSIHNLQSKDTIVFLKKYLLSMTSLLLEQKYVLYFLFIKPCNE